MSEKERSGAQGRKRKREVEIASKKSSLLLAFLMNAKKKAGAALFCSSQSKDRGYQPLVSGHVDANDENINDSKKKT